MSVWDVGAWGGKVDTPYVEMMLEIGTVTWFCLNSRERNLSETGGSEGTISCVSSFSYLWSTCMDCVFIFWCPGLKNPFSTRL